MTSALFLVLLFITFIFMVAILVNRFYYIDDVVEEDEVVTTTTTITTYSDDPNVASVVGATQFGRQIQGNIKRGWENNVPFVYDPVDGDKVMLDIGDDMYEDANGGIWTLE